MDAQQNTEKQDAKTHNKKTIVIDGSFGEGGGQVLRTALTLSLLTGRDLQISNIRAGRKRPGLLRQHLTCVKAAIKISGGQATGVKPGSTELYFKPGQVLAGDYHFAIGTAGSTSLVCQTIFLPLALTGQTSRITFEGGTHNGMSPSVTFLDKSWLPIMKGIGIDTILSLEKYGFYPAGGGRWTLTINPMAIAQTQVLSFPVLCPPIPEYLFDTLKATVLLSRLRRSVATDEIAEVQQQTGMEETASEVIVTDSSGPGNSVILTTDGSQSVVPGFSYCFEETGDINLAEKKVAQRVSQRYLGFVNSNAQIDEHLADQLLLPMLVAGSGEFTTTKLSSHTITNIAIIEQIQDCSFTVEGLPQGLWRIALN